MSLFNGCSEKSRCLAVLGATLLIPALAAADVRTTTDISPPDPFGTAGDGMIFEDDPFAGREVVKVRVTWDVVVAGGHDAARILADVQLPIHPYSGTAGIDLDGTALGWSGSGTFNHYEATDRYNGFFGEVGTWWGWQSWGLPFEAVDVLPTSRIEIDYLVPEPRMPGDFDNDGDVDGDDFLAWQGGFGTQAGAQKSDGDYDNDGDVDGDDFLGWQGEFGSGSGAVSAAVPEPTSVLLVFLACAAACSALNGRRRLVLR